LLKLCLAVLIPGVLPPTVIAEDMPAPPTINILPWVFLPEPTIELPEDESFVTIYDEIRNDEDNKDGEEFEDGHEQ